MDQSNTVDSENTIADLKWSDLDLNADGKVTINKLGEFLRQRGLAVSNFVILKTLCDGGAPPLHSLDQETFEETKNRLIKEHNTQGDIDPESRKKENLEIYLDLWRQYSGASSDDGHIPLSDLKTVVLGECNPSCDLLDTLMAIKKSDENDALTFDEFCDMLENLPTCAMMDEDALQKAFRMVDVNNTGYVSRMQLFRLLVENGRDPLSKAEVDEMMDDCGEGDKFNYSEWIQRVITVKSVTGT